jgi:hypothetical protein
VPESAKSETRSDTQLTIDDQAGSESLDNQHEQQGLDRCFVKRSVPEFGKRRSVRVILDKHRKLQSALKDLADSDSVPLQIRRTHDRAGLAIDESGQTYTDCGKTRSRKLLADHSLDRIGQGV